MLTTKQVKGIRDHLSNAQNPVFFFDNDCDGLCSFLLMQRFTDKGKGIPITAYQGLTEDYFKYVNEFEADYIFILDKPVVTKEFFDRVQEVNIPVVWIDHHPTDKEAIPDFVNYFNPVYNRKRSNEPVTALCYQVTDRSYDMWLGVIGCAADRFIPEFYPEFMKENPDLCVEADDGFGIYYDSEIGKIARILGFALKDKPSNVGKMMRYLIQAKNPRDVLNESPENESIHGRYKEIQPKYKKMIDKALEVAENSGDVVFFHYKSETGITSELSNEINYRFPEKYVVVFHMQDIKTKLSARGENVRKIILKAMKEFEGAKGGGHENAVGGLINSEDMESFENKIKSLVEEQKQKEIEENDEEDE